MADGIMKPKRGCPCEIRDVWYPSQAEAGRQLGVSTSVIFNAIERGNTDGVGLGRNWNRLRPVIMDGDHYSSQCEAARAGGINQHHLNRKLWGARKQGKTKVSFKGHIFEFPNQ